ncbi:hypothetical protein [Streptomyces sp. NPDC057582]|uniref:hypothetical protein n=1 Tax=unclassified Streptomyces TaxID=2593676 RepID=UPI0036A6E4BC
MRGNRLGCLAADLEAELRAVDARPEHSTTVYDGIWLTLPPTGIYWKDFAWLAFGASLMQRQLSEAYPGGVQIQVHNLVYPLADYKLEVAAVCMTGWLREQLDAPDPGIVVRADLERGAFLFEWGDLVGDPFTE